MLQLNNNNTSSMKKTKLSKQKITTIVASILLVLTHIAIIAAILLSFKYYAIYPSLFGSIVCIVVCFLIIVDIIFFVGFNHKDLALKILSCTLALLMLIGGTFGAVYIKKVNNIVYSVLDENKTKTEKFGGVFVCYDQTNMFSSLTDLSGKKVGMLKETSNGISYIAKNKLNDEKVDCGVVEYNTNNELLTALIDNEVDAVVITQGYRTIYDKERDENSPFASYLDNFVDFYSFEEELKVTTNKKAKNINKEPFNVLLIGYSRTEIGSSVGLADSIIVATINPQTYTVSMMSIARDSFVPIACYGGEYDKINSGRSTSRACFIETVENFIGMDIDYYMELDYLGLVQIVNTIGGVVITNPVEFELDGIYVPEGHFLADGQQALQFCRERHHMPNGDFDRQQHQKEVIIAIAKKFIEEGNVSLALEAMENASDWMSTDFTLTELTSVFNLLLNTKNNTSLDTFDLVDFQTLRMTGSGGLMYYSYSMHLPLWVYLIYQDSYDESVNHIHEVMGNYNTINQKSSFNFSAQHPYDRPLFYSLNYPDRFMFTPDPMPAYWIDLEGMTLEEAMAWASSNGVTLSVGEIISPADPSFNSEMQGLICGQSIRYGSLVSEYKTGTVTVMGSGDINLDDYYVPDFIGKDVSRVLDWAYEHGIDVHGTEGYESGRIVESQDPEGGTPIKDVTDIRIKLSEPEKYKVSFDSQGGSSCSSITVEQGSNYGELPKPTKSGYKFDGWYTSATGGSHISDYDDVEISSDITLYAHWSEAKTYKYKYVDEAGTTLQEGTFIDGEGIPDYVGENPTKADDDTYTYTFDGWNKEVNAKGNVTLSPIFTSTEKETEPEIEYPYSEECDLDEACSFPDPGYDPNLNYYCERTWQDAETSICACTLIEEQIEE